MVTKLPNEKIVKKKAPFSMLDGNILASHEGIPERKKSLHDASRALEAKRQYAYNAPPELRSS